LKWLRGAALWFVGSYQIMTESSLADKSRLVVGLITETTVLLLLSYFQLQITDDKNQC